MRLKPRVCKLSGYRYVTLMRPEGGYSPAKVSALVCEAFYGPRPNKHHAAHENGDRLDDSSANLSWKTPTDNIADQKRHGTWSHGECQHMAKLTAAAVVELRDARSAGATWQEIADQFGITPRTCRDVVRGRTWKHV